MRQSSDVTHRSGPWTYKGRLHWRTDRCWCDHLDGGTGTLHGWHLHRTPVAVVEMRGPPPLHGLTDGFITERVIAEWIRLHGSERTCPACDGRSAQEAGGCCRPLDPVDQERALALVLQVE